MRNFQALAISGMTGSGKTKLALAVAKRLNGELICGDNTQMYQGLATLTNKQDIKNGHLYNRYTIHDEVDTNTFTLAAREAIKDVLSRDKLPIVEGGSFYHHVQLFKGNSIRESEDHVKTMQEMRTKARDMIKKLQGTASQDEADEIDAKIGELIEKVGLPSD